MSPSPHNFIYPWQEDAWDQLQQARGRLPHAILLHGDTGSGKTDFATHFAQSLLCQRPLEGGHACGVCDACGWFTQYAHPDFRRVRPEILDGGDDADGEEDGAEPRKAAKSVKAPSKEIRIEQVRALAGFMNLSTHRNGMRVVLLYPAESLNTASANALLKTLEEPPPNTVILLVCHRIDRLLPTILSRCRKFAMPMPARAEALAWLKAQQVKDAEVWLAEQGGAPLAALAQSQAGSRELLDDFLQQLSRPGREAALATAERLQKAPVTELVAWMQRWLVDVFSCKLSGTIRYYPSHRAQLATLAARAEVDDLLGALQAITQRRAIAEHPLSAKLFIEDMLLDYARIFS
ncbi:MAG: DNA polymerase III subunit delta' [Herminiimonas sp.]|nr:DNA polymerase III subunit delta' [Herminiimonas sp.]